MNSTRLRQSKGSGWCYSIIAKSSWQYRQLQAGLSPDEMSQWNYGSDGLPNHNDCINTVLTNRQQWAVCGVWPIE